MSFNQHTLFDMTPDEKTGEIDKTKIEYVQLAFELGNKKKFYVMCEKLLKIYNLDNYTDLVHEVIKETYEKNFT